jgi:ferrochelatase
VLLNLGGPTGEDAIRPFLYNLFADPDIIKLGGGRAQRWLARFISGRRAPKVLDKYRSINACPKGCTGNALCPNRLAKVCSTACSPINPLTERQRRALEKTLKASLPGTWVKCYTAMRYWQPTTEQVLHDLQRDGVTHVVLLPLYPQFSYTSTGSSFREWETVRRRVVPSGSPWQEFVIKNYYQNPNYVQAINARVSEALERFPSPQREQVHIVFSAHGTPIAEVNAGDPYTREIAATIEAVMAERGHSHAYWHAFQSRVGPARWTEPNTQKLAKRLLAYGVRNMLMVPVAFVTDHIETFVELRQELVEDVHNLGLQQLEVTQGLNDHPLFIGALAEEVHRVLAPSLEAVGRTLAEIVPPEPRIVEPNEPLLEPVA